MVYSLCIKYRENQEVIQLSTLDLIPKLVRAAYADDVKTVDTVSIMLGRKLKKDYPDVSKEILQIAADYKVGADVYRSIDISPVPVDRETHDSLVNVEENVETEPPILSADVEDQFEDFIKERSLIQKFLQEGIRPSNSLLMYGSPGVGKTYSARWLAYRLQMPMITVDLASTISSYLGRSGQNIKSVFEYTKRNNIILFLDEIDAIAKKRDDETDLGELKRLVNVLLKEMEDCPTSCIIIGATNHPELLDRAVWRRFDRSIELSVPAEGEREKLFKRGLDKWYDTMTCTGFLIAKSSGMSAADICRLCDHIKRQIIMNESTSIDYLAIKELCHMCHFRTKDEKVKVCHLLKSYVPNISIRGISEAVGIPQASVARYLKEEGYE